MMPSLSSLCFFVRPELQQIDLPVMSMFEDKKQGKKRDEEEDEEENEAHVLTGGIAITKQKYFVPTRPSKHFTSSPSGIKVLLPYSVPSLTEFVLPKLMVPCPFGACRRHGYLTGFGPILWVHLGYFFLFLFFGWNRS